MRFPDRPGARLRAGWNTLRGRIRPALFFLCFFYLVYTSAAWIADGIPWRFRVVFAWERNIPFLPETAVVYTSIIGLMLLALLCIRDEEDLRLLLRVLCLETVVGGVVFVLVPLENGFPPRETSEALPLVFRVADMLNLHNNFLPSLHVCFALTLAAVLSFDGGRFRAMILYGWAVLISVSTMTIHEHTLADIVAGAVLAAWGARYWRRRAGSGQSSENRDFGQGKPPVEGEGASSGQRHLFDAGAVDNWTQPTPEN